MALKTCIECGKEHSDTITTCPNCGYVTPIETHPLTVTLRTFGATISIFIIANILHGVPFGMFILIISLFTLVACPYFWHKKEHHIGYKIASYIIWGIPTLFYIYATYIELFVLNK